MQTFTKRYDELVPWDLVVNVHWKAPGMPPPTFPAHCETYGYGAKIAFVNPGLISALPYGPDVAEPFVGTFNAGVDTSGHPIEVTAAPYGLHAQNVTLQKTYLSLTNQQILGLYVSDPTSYFASFPTPMIIGYEALGYDIEMNWQGPPGSDAEVGFGLTHLYGGQPYPPPSPPAPFLIGSGIGGTLSYEYDWNDDAVFDPSNQFDPVPGGPIYLWWMSRRAVSGGGFSAWSANGVFMVGDNFNALNDWYTWKVSGRCGALLPGFFVPPATG